MVTRVLLLLCLASPAALACRASLPTEATSPSVSLVGLQVHYSFATASPIPGAAISLRAYAVDSDSVFHEVTEQATWVSSNPDVMRVARPGRVEANTTGAVEITASHGGVTGSLALRVVPTITVTAFPRIRILTPFEPRPGQTEMARAQYLQSDFSFQDVTDLATWTSSAPDVATVTRGRVTGVAVGTAEITVSYNGISSSYGFSVPPRFR